MLAALAAMAIVMGLGLRRADQLLDRLARSQGQLTQVTQIEANIDRLRADLANGTDRRDAAVAASGIEAQLAAYRASILTEERALIDTGGDTAEQDKEAADAVAMAGLFAALRGDLLAGAEPGRTDAARRAFDDRARLAVARERGEAADAIEAMRALRRRTTLLGVAAPLLAALAGAAGAGAMLSSLLRPLRALETAAMRAGRGEPPAPVEVRGFSEFNRLAQAFDRMDRQIAAQREKLFRANHDLEGQVADRVAEIEASRQQLAAIDATRRLFFSQIGHELRTPATVIRGEAEVALRDPAAPVQRLREALSHIVANGDFLQRRLEDMLTLAQAEDGRIAAQRAPVDLSALVRAVFDLAQPYVRSSGAALELDMPADTQPTLLGDASWLQQALLALIDNAAKFGGGAPIRVSLRADDGAATITVADSGPGVDAADLPFLFDSYYQAGSGRGGSGLGLSIARWVAQQHGGAVSARGGDSGGLIITLTLPVLA